MGVGRAWAPAVLGGSGAGARALLAPRPGDAGRGRRAVASRRRLLRRRALRPDAV